MPSVSRHTSRHYIQWQTFSNPLMTKTMSKRSQKTPRPKLVNVWWHTHLIHTLCSTLTLLPDQDGIHSILLHSFLRPIALARIKPAWEDSISSKGKVHCLQTYPCFECMLVWILEWIGLFTTPRSMKPANPAVVSKATDITTPPGAEFNWLFILTTDTNFTVPLAQVLHQAESVLHQSRDDSAAVVAHV